QDHQQPPSQREESNMADKSNSIMFIHGLWLHPTSWADWMAFFAEAGYEVSAPGWPGDAPTVEEARAHPDSVANYGIDDIVRHYTDVIQALPRPPILIGHSFGGMFAE